MVSKVGFMRLVSKCDTAISCFVLQSLCLNNSYTYVYSLNKWIEETTA